MLHAPQAGEQSVGLHLVAALQALRREAELLEPYQRNHLAGLLRDAEAATPALTTPAALPANPNRVSTRPPPAPAPVQPGASPGGSSSGGGRPAEGDWGDQGSWDEQGASFFQPQRVTVSGGLGSVGWGGPYR